MHRINQLLNVSSREWPRILVAWSMVFFTRFGFIVGWSILMATFLSKIGIEYLPILFFANAIMIMLGTVIFQRFMHKIKREVIIAGTIITAAAFLIGSTLFINNNTTAFFALLLTAESILLAQLSILVSLYTEDLFTPLESQRTFPVIESAETIGGILGGLALGLFANQIPAYKFILVWAISVLCILPVILFFKPKYKPHLQTKNIKEKQFKNNRERFRELKKIPFLKGLMVVIALHWAMMNVIEFQYTKAIQQEVYSLQEETIVLDGYEGGVVLASEDYTHEQELYYEQSMAQKLGALHMIFSSAALFIQLILGSRILTSLGVVSTLFLHPIITLLNLIGLTLRFSLFTAAFTRGSYELTGLLFKNAYDSSYYATPEQKRSDVKELMQGIMKPLGAILGTVAIAAIALTSSGIQQTLSLNLVLLAMGVAMSALALNLKEKYSRLSEQNLSKKTDLATRINAIEILGQNGHEQSTNTLQKLLARESESEIIKYKILKTLGERKEIDSIGSILNALHENSTKLRGAAIKALSEFGEMKKSNKNQSFTRIHIIKELKKAIAKEESNATREKMIAYLYKVAPDELIRFLLQSIEKNTEKKAAFIRMLKLFNDPNLKHYLEPQLENKDPELRAASIIALWQFKDMRKSLEHHLKQLLKSRKIILLKLGIEVCGELQLKEYKQELRGYIQHKNSTIKEVALLALAKMEDHHAMEELFKNLTNPMHEWFNAHHDILEGFPKRFKQSLESKLSNHMQLQLDSSVQVKI